jgi:hypothetical protein
MKKTATICVIELLAFALLLLQSAFAGTSEDQKQAEMLVGADKTDVDSLLIRLADTDPKNWKGREAAVADMRRSHSKLIKQLVELAAEKVEPQPPFNLRIKEYPWHDRKHLAIILLGDLRAPEGVPMLFQNLEYMNPKSISVDESLREIDWYPAVEALTKIGLPAVKPGIDELAKLAPGTERGKLCCLFLKQALGAKLARARIEIGIEETRDKTAKENLKASLAYFKTDQEKAAEERAKRSEGAR